MRLTRDFLGTAPSSLSGRSMTLLKELSSIARSITAHCLYALYAWYTRSIYEHRIMVAITFDK